MTAPLVNQRQTQTDWSHLAKPGEWGGVWIQPKITTNPSKLGHMFRRIRNAILKGHFALDTPEARAFIESATAHPRNYVGTDRDGSGWYVKTHPNGTQAWAEVRHGKIVNGGINYLPRVWDPVKKKMAPPPQQLSHQPTNAFKERLQVTNLVKSFNSCHSDHPMPERSGTSGQIGGVGNEVGIIEGMFDGLEALRETEHAFFFPAPPEGFSLTQDEIQQLMHELAEGIFVHDTVPFFSLHFNGDTNMYPVIHPAYQNTFAGHVISMLDYYMKGFLNGGYFNADFVERWNQNPRMDEKTLKANIIDVRELCKQHLGPDCKYESIKEMIGHLEQLEKMMQVLREPGDHSLIRQTLEAKGILTQVPEQPEEHPILKDYSGFRSSFRIIAHQNSIKKAENLFLADGDFDVLYTITPDPAYEEELAKYRQATGMNPPSYQRLEIAYARMSKQIKAMMPRIPEFKKLFEALNVINFFCYYFNTLKKAGKFPLLNRKIYAPTDSCPSLFPHLPMRANYQEEMPLKLAEFFKGISRDQVETIEKGVLSDPFKEQAIESLAQNLQKYVFANAKYPLSKKYREIDAYKEIGTVILELLKQKHEHVKAQLQPQVEQELRHWKWEVERRSGFWNSLSMAMGDSHHPENTQIAKKNVEILEREQDKLTNHPLSYEFPDETILQLMIQNDDSILHSYQEHKLEDERQSQKRIVGGCGVELGHKPIKADPAVSSMLDHLFGPLSRLKEEETLAVSEDGHKGIVFKFKYSDLPLLDEEDKETALGYLSHPTYSMSDAHVAVFQAIATGDEEMLKIAGDQIEDWSVIRDSLGMNPLHHAACSGNPLILDYLLQKVSANSRDLQGNTALHYASQAGNLPAVLAILARSPGLINATANGGETPLYMAIQNNQLSTVRVLLSKGADPNCKTAQGMNALMCAIHHGFTDVALELLKFPIDLTHTLDDKTNALHLACSLNQPQVVDALIQKGIDVNAGRWDGHAALHLAAKSGNLAMVKSLVSVRNMNLNVQLKSGKTALHLAAEKDHYDIVEYLLQKGADPTLFGWDRETILHSALRYGSIHSALYIANFVKGRSVTIEKKQIPLIHVKNMDGQTAMEFAARCKMFEIWMVLFDPLKDDPNATPLSAMEHLLLLCQKRVDPAITMAFIQKQRFTPDQLNKAYEAACKNGNEALVGSLLLEGPQEITPFRTKQDWTDMQYAAKFNLFTLLKSLMEQESTFLDDDLIESAEIAAQYGSLKSLEILMEVLDKRRILNDKIFNDLFVVAIGWGQYQAVDLILHKKPDFFQVGIRDIYPAVANNDVEMLKLLRKRGAELDDPGTSALRCLFDVAISHKLDDVLDYLLDSQNQFSTPENLLHLAAFKGTPKILTRILERSSNLNAEKPITKKTPLHVAIEANNLENVILLCKQGASLQSQDKDGNTPLHFAAKIGGPVLHYLLQHNPPLNAVNHAGQTPLHMAAIEGRDDSVELLMQYGCDPSLRDLNGLAPVDTAERLKFFPIMALLQGDKSTLEQKKAAIVESLIKKDQETFFNLIRDWNPETSLVFALPGKEKQRLPLPHLIYHLVKNNEARTSILHLFEQWAGGNISGKDAKGRTLLHLTALAGEDPPFQGSISKLLLTRDNEGITPLHFYAQSESLERYAQVFDRLSPPTREAANNAIMQEDQEGRSPLYYAVAQNRIDIALYLLKKGASPETRDFQLVTLLGLAIKNNSLPMIQMLVENGASIDAPIGLKNSSPLHFAIHLGKDEIVRWLVQNGANVSQKDPQGREPLHIAAAAGNLGLVRFLHACGASFFAVDNRNSTVMNYAVQSKCMDLVVFLAAKGVSLDPAADAQMAPLHIATAAGNLPMLVQFAHYGANLDVQDSDGMSALPIAALSGNPRVLELFSESTLMEDRDQVFKAIRVAIQIDHVQQLRILRKNCPNVNQRLEFQLGRTMLHWACISGAKNVVLDLLKDGADPLLPDCKGGSPFALAVLNNHYEIADLLSSQTTIDVNQKLVDERTYLHVACENDNISLMALLINLGARLDDFDAVGRTVLHIAASKGNRRMVQLLLFAGATLGGKSVEAMTDDLGMRAFITDLQQQLESSRDKGEGRLHAAVRLSDIDALLALSNTEDVYQRDGEGRTPLHIAMEQKSLALLRRLIEIAPDLEVQDNQGRSALFIAAAVTQNPKLVRFLLDLGANPKAALKDGTSILEGVRRAGDSPQLREISQLLLGTKPSQEAMT